MDIVTPLENVSGERNVESDVTSPFDGVKAPVIPIREYVSLLGTHVCQHVNEIIYAIYYMWKYTDITSATINVYNVHRIFLVSILVVHKVLNDIPYRNKWICKVGGISLDELNNMELKFLEILEWDFHLVEEVERKQFETIAEEISGLSYGTLLKLQTRKFFSFVIDELETGKDCVIYKNIFIPVATIGIRS
jgi:hypothetical protein